jgi:Clp amino terminal domain, pathogenicity island component/Ankyrin repeat
MKTPRRPKRLPINPSLEHLQKQAKRLARENPALQLTAAQHQLAQEYGCKNWTELARMVEAMSQRQEGVTDDDQRLATLPKAARDGDFELVRRLLEEGTYTPHRLDQALAHALQYGDDANWEVRKATADLLMEHGADPNGQYGSGGYGPIVFGTAECLQPLGLEYLIQAGADVSAPPIETKYGLTCVMSAALGTYTRGRNAQKHRYIELLLQHGAYVPPEVTGPIMAIHRGDVATLGALLDADPALVHQRFADMPYGTLSLRGATLLHCAAEFGEMWCVGELLKHGADVNAAADLRNGVGGQTPIFHAMACAGNGSPLSLHALLHGPWRQKLDLSLRATCQIYGKNTPEPMTPAEFGTYLGQQAGPKLKERVLAAATLLQKRAGDQAAGKPMHNFTEPATAVLGLARREVDRSGHQSIEPEHVLLALLGIGSLARSSAHQLFERLHVASDTLRTALEGGMAATEPAVPPPGRAMIFGRGTKLVLGIAGNEARHQGHEQVGTAHLLYGVAGTEGGLASRVLHEAGLTPDRLRAEMLGASESDPQWLVE